MKSPQDRESKIPHLSKSEDNPPQESDLPLETHPQQPPLPPQSRLLGGDVVIEEDEWHLIRTLHLQGLNITEIADEVGRDRKTVSKYLKSPGPPRYRQRSPGPSILDQHKDFIDEQLEHAAKWNRKPNAALIYQQLRASGFEGSESLVRKYIQPQRQGRFAALPAPRFETKPGKQMQVDWGEEFKLQLEDGRLVKLYCFTAVLGFSRSRYVEFTLDTKTQTLIRCMQNCFEYYGGVPEHVLFDNMKSVALKAGSKKTRKLNQVFEDFSEVLGFEVELCPVKWPRRKGKVERLVQYVKGNLWPRLRSIESLEELNRFSILWCDEVNAQPHGTTREVPAVRLEKIECALLKPIRRFTVYETVNRKVSHDCYVQYRTNRYSVPDHICGLRVQVKIIEGRLEVILNGELMQQHEVSLDRYVTVDDPLSRRKLQQRVADALRSRASTARPRLPPLKLAEGEVVEQRDLTIYENLVRK